MTNVRLDDNRVISSANFEIRQNKYRPLGPSDCYEIRRAERACRRMPKYSVVIATRGEIVGCAYGFNDQHEACKFAGEQFLSLYKTRRLRIPARGVVTVINFPPTRANALSLAGSGVDVIFTSERIADSQANDWFVEQFVGPHLAGNPTKWTPDLLRPAMAHIAERRVFVQPKWKAKSWEK